MSPSLPTGSVLLQQRGCSALAEGQTQAEIKHTKQLHDSEGSHFTNWTMSNSSNSCAVTSPWYPIPKVDTGELDWRGQPVVRAMGLVPQSCHTLGLASADTLLMLHQRSWLDMYLHLPIMVVPAPSWFLWLHPHSKEFHPNIWYISSPLSV